MIYGYTDPTNHINITSGYMKATVPEKLDHWRSVDYVSGNMHEGLGEQCFCVTCFEFGRNMACLPLLLLFRTMATSKVGYSPACYLANVQINIDCGYDIDPLPTCQPENEANTSDDGWTSGGWTSANSRYGTKVEIVTSTAGSLSHLESVFGF
jgi:hypothetical protein